MKKFIFGLALVCGLYGSSATALIVQLNNAQGLPGDLFSIILSVDEVPTSFGLFTLEGTLDFDIGQIEYIGPSSKRDLLIDSGSAQRTDFSDLMVISTATPGSLSVQVSASYWTLPQPATGGDLAELIFRILDTPRAGNSNVQFTTSDLNGSAPTAAATSNATVAINAVPVPPALLLFMSPILWLFTRKRVV